MSERTVNTGLAKLSVAQIVGLLVPWMTVPFLLRTLGVSEYGWLMLATTVMQYLSVITEYSYGITGPRDVSRAADQPGGLESYVSSFYTARFVLLVICLAVLVPCIWLLPVCRWSLFAFAFLNVIGTTLMPTAVLYGLQEFDLVAKLSLGSRIVPAALIFLLVRKPTHTALTVGLQSGTYLLFAIFALVLVRSRLPARWPRPSWRMIREELRRGAGTFASVAAVAAYTAGPTILLGAFTSPQVVGYYTAADKTLTAAKGGIMPVFQVYFPRIAKLPPDQVRLSNRLIRRLLVIALTIAIGASAVMGIFPEGLSHLLSGADAPETASVMRRFSVLPVILVGVFLFNDTIHLCLNLESARTRTLLRSAALFLIVSPVVVGAFRGGATGMATCVVLTEFSIALSSMIGYWRRQRSMTGPKGTHGT